MLHPFFILVKNKMVFMLTVLEAIKKSTKYLEEKGIESPRINAELLLADILECKRLQLYLSFDRPLDEEEVNRYREYIARRGKFEPLQYITGKVDFYNLTLNVNKHVLIPRQETELLIEKAIEICRQKNYRRILDVGTGSGNISIALAKDIMDVEITGIDISHEAIEVAKQNADLNNTNGKIEFVHTDILTFKPATKYDMIISNPPYVSTADYPTLQKEILDYEPKNAVTDDSDGYKYFKYLVGQSDNLLNKNGSLLFEIAEGQAEEIKGIMELHSFHPIEIIKDYQGIDRVLVGERI